MSEEEHKEIFIHSACCMGHWELTYHSEKYELKCEVCGKPAPNIITIGPPLEGKCEICELEKKKKEGLMS